MDINFKLIPYQNNPNFIYTIQVEENCTFKDIIKNFIQKGFMLKFLSDVKFISNGRQFSSMDDKLTSDNTIFYLFTNSELAKQHLKETIYKEVSYIVINEQPLEEPSDITIDVIDNDEINTINEEIKETLTPQLLDLLYLCVQKPDLLNKVNSYLQSGNIESPIEIVDIDEDTFTYNSEFEYINTHFNQYCWDHKVIKNVLNYYKGHLNLSIRYLINGSLVRVKNE